jgi:hypothetical protein
MKRFACGLLGAVFAIVGFILLLNTLYNLAGLAGIQDGGSGSNAELVQVSALFAILTAMAFFAAHRLFRVAKTSVSE